MHRIDRLAHLAAQLYRRVAEGNGNESVPYSYAACGQTDPFESGLVRALNQYVIRVYRASAGELRGTVQDTRTGDTHAFTCAEEMVALLRHFLPMKKQNSAVSSDSIKRSKARRK